MDGATALNYVRQRHNLPGGDFDRVKRQQNWIRAVIRTLGSSGTLRNPVALDRALTTLSRSVSTDAGFDIERISDLVTSMSGLEKGRLQFLTMPNDGSGWSPDGKQSIVKIDRASAPALFKAVRVDRVTDWMQRYRPDLLPDVVR
jgi:anionic cell wall polymer biosynthesis LytR-Cps2A-Psr (LCP) family protein